MSKSVGIVAEYNPFHTGHKYQIDCLREKGYENIIIAMSGSCVQRGELAFLPKFDKAKMALESGANLVAEIPFPYSIRSAEGYAMAGMQTLKALGVEAISFGSECGDIDLLEKIASYLLSEEYEIALRKYLAEVVNFATAREKAIFDKFSINRDVVSASNDILGIEYIKACKKLNWQPEFVIIKRKGADYNQKGEKDGFASASGIRKMVSEYRFDTVMKYIPSESQHTFSQCMDRGRYFLPDMAYEKAVLFTLRNKTASDFMKITDCNTELANSFEKAANSADSMESLFNLLPTKNYTRARLNRIILSVLLDTNNDFPKDIQYIRILGFDKNGEEHLKTAYKNCPLPISHSPKILSEKNELCKKIVTAENKACDTQGLFCKFSTEPRQDYKQKLIKK